MKTLKVWHVVLSVVCVLFIVLCIYGLKTDCPNTAGYVFCGDSDSQSLQH